MANCANNSTIITKVQPNEANNTDVMETNTVVMCFSVDVKENKHHHVRRASLYKVQPQLQEWEGKFSSLAMLHRSQQTRRSDPVFMSYLNFYNTSP